MEFHHISVLWEETLAALVKNPEGTYVDCTLGGGGHAGGIVERLTLNGHFIGIDQDPAAINAGKARLAKAECQVDIVNSNFSNIRQVLADLQVEAVDGILFDLGVSSHQLDAAERGFSYMQDAPLDMRMNPEHGFSAFHVVNQYSEAELTKILYTYGEERWAKRIARFIVEARKNSAIGTTGQLVDIIKKAIPAAARREGPHPAKRTFQAIRIEVNQELGVLKDAFTAACSLLKPGGRLCIITFHSLEDRIAKQTLQGLAKACICPPQLPVCRCENKAQLKILGKPVAASMDEVAQNPRARSAKLRVAEKL
ncbi:16S rRNA (cytosine(1402)-N(4))-methyltransferase RsmH|uniref:Ribosomal RNA small subunit methyltransferase H n=1 Tax=Dendrosporobacter quercicolus TaxID=146817 RepID=A0A1G9MEB0_9FIRM|nr:16S rRNA (cytosine(1402)-N(4))-methyltransferase RsmH [Dendrosporobacter quercicolus]NSL47009.1 16S rRNA (cytosine(1402)-N(4))-methyltransferase RsmH [Dendrosporobacter quercicolus DSM 1736]SDL72443.1 16S rRNA (cytosine1402-N4)-methyltransferase [Dendrosporobacter quercicolus]